jgi:ribonuclease Z
MSGRELVVLGTASQSPTKVRNHNGYLLRWSGEGVLFDPGEGTQRQMALAGVSSSTITRICITHFHGDHCLGLPGVIQLLSLDRVPGPIPVYYPAGGRVFFERLRHASAYIDAAEVRGHPCEEGVVEELPAFRIVARHLDHRIDTLGWRLEEPDGRRMLPEKLAAAGIEGPDVGRIIAEGSIVVDGRRVHLEQVSEHRPGQVVAFVMDTAVCDAAYELADGADLLVCESTFLDAEADLAAKYKHLTAAQAARLAAESGVGRLVLSHFSRRYRDLAVFREEAGAIFPDVVVAEDFTVVPLPRR